jgi:hypothetical protein
MNNLKNKAAELNLYVSNEIPKEYTQSQILNGSTFDYSDKVNNNYTLPSEILQKYEHGLFWECRKQYTNTEPQQVELYYIEHSRLLFLSPKGNLLRLVKDRQNKYSFSLDYSHYKEVQKVSYNTRILAQKESNLIEPNKIGVFTDKKIIDWLNYCDKEAELNNKIVQESNNKNKDIEAEIQNFINSVPCKVSKWDNKTDIQTKYFRVLFTHDKSSQYLSKQITFSGLLTDIINIENK